MRAVPAPSLMRHFGPEEVDEAVRCDRILTLSIKLPVKCNLRCRYCYGGGETGDMGFDEYVRVAEQARDLGARSVSILGEGEPMLYRAGGEDIFSLIDRINALGLSVTLFTNNTLIGPREARQLFERDVAVVAKLNSLSPDIQERLSGSGSGRGILRGLEALKSAGFNRTSPSRLAIHTVMVRDNRREIMDMWRMCRRENIVPYFQAFVPPRDGNRNRGYAGELSVPSGDLRRLFLRLRELDKAEHGFEWDADYTYPIAGMGCGVIRSGCAVDSFGDVRLCAYLDQGFGNVRREPLRRILAKEAVRKVRRFDYSGADGRAHFYGCRVMAFHLTGDRFSEDPLFWKSRAVVDS